MTSAADPAVRHDYDLLVIGSGPGGQKAAIAASKLGKRVAVVERRGMVGGVCTHFVIGREVEVIRSQLQRNRVDLLSGAAVPSAREQ